MTALAEPTVIRTSSSDIVPLTTSIELYGGNEPLSIEIIYDSIKPLSNSSSTKLKDRNLPNELSTASKEMLKKLYQFKNLKANWDGIDAKPPQTKVVDDAISFLKVLDEMDLSPYFVAPGPNGEILLEYKSENHSAEIYFEENNDPEMIIYNNKDQIYAGSVDKERLIRHII